MATIKREVEFYCSDDCRIEGCPKHKGVFTFQTTTNAFCWSVDGDAKYFDSNELEEFVKILKDVSSFRVDMPRVN